MGGLVLVLIPFAVALIYWLMFAVLCFFEGRTAQRIGHYSNDHAKWLAWAYDAGYDSPWRAKDITRRNSERYTQRKLKQALKDRRNHGSSDE